MKTYGWGGGITPIFSNSALEGGEWPASCHGRFTPRERGPGIAWIGGSISSSVGLDVANKREICSPYRETNLDTSGARPVP
jgi:hypothetical protein